MARPIAEHPRHRLRARLRPLCLALLLVAAPTAPSAWAQQDASDTAAPRQALRVVPRISLTETFTDNVDQSANARRTEQISQISPGVHISRDSGRVKGYMDYALSALAYAQGSHNATLLHALSTVGQVDALDNWLLLDFDGSVSQQSVSAFGLQPAGISSGLGTAGSTEWSRWSVSPYVQGVLGGQVNYVARLRRSLTHSNTALSSDVGESQAGINLGSGSHLGRLGWVFDASRYGVNYSAGRATEADQVDAGLSLAFTDHLSGVLKFGREASNYTSQDKQTFATSDASLSWQASAQLQASAAIGQRSFGHTHAVNVEYRTARVVLRLADRRDVSAVPGQILPVLLVPIPGGRPVIGSFVTTAVAIQDRQDLSLSLLGSRDTLTLGASSSENSRLDTLSQTSDELASGKVRQSGLSLAFNHRLTPRYSLDLLSAWQQATAASGVQDSTLREWGVRLNARLARSTNASVGLRRAVSSGPAPYEENALVLGLVAEF